MTTLPRAAIRAVVYHQPETRVTNEDLTKEFPDWTPEKIKEKLGVDERRIARPDEFSSDLAVAAAKRLFDSGATTPDEIDYLIVSTQTPDYFIPSTCCLVQNKIGLSKNCGGLDISLGCSGYVYGLGLAKGLIESGQARNILFITADTNSKFIHPRDRSVRTLFGDAATATIISSDHGVGRLAGPFAYGTDGSGAEHLIVHAGGMRRSFDPNAASEFDASGNERTMNDLHMNGAEVFAFTIREVPPLINRVLEPQGLTMNDVDFFVFHQANGYLLSHLQRKLNIPPERFTIDMADCGNTGSSAIPIALSRAVARGAIHAGMRVMLVAFGVGFSWGATLVQWE